MQSVIACIIGTILCIAIFFNRPLVLMFFDTYSLPMYLASKNTLKLLGKENTKENRQYIRKMCCEGHKFTDDFIKYADCTCYSHTIENLGITMYEYISFKEKTKEVHDNEGK